MTDIKKHIQENRYLVDDQFPSEESFDRFLEKAGYARRSKVHTLWPYLASFAAIAAAIAIFVIPRISTRGGINTMTEQEYYASYLTFVNNAMQEVRGYDTTGEWTTMLETMTYEGVPMAEQLPEELPEESRLQILQEHYSTIMDGVTRIIKSSKE